MSFWSGYFANYNQPDEFEVWDDRPGGTVVDRYSYNGVDYVVVEFKNTPGARYTFLAS